MFSLIVIPILVTMVTQIIKLITDGIPFNLTWQHLMADYGGMPSAHAAFVVSLLTLVGIRDGLDSTGFAIAFAVMIIVIRDAVGFRMEIGKNAVLTNTLAKEIFPANPEIQVTERIGHTMSQVMAGLAVGILLTLLMYYITMLF